MKLEVEHNHQKHRKNKEYKSAVEQKIRLPRCCDKHRHMVRCEWVHVRRHCGSSLRTNNDTHLVCGGFVARMRRDSKSSFRRRPREWFAASLRVIGHAV